VPVEIQQSAHNGDVHGNAEGYLGIHFRVTLADFVGLWFVVVGWHLWRIYRELEGEGSMVGPGVTAGMVELAIPGSWAFVGFQAFLADGDAFVGLRGVLLFRVFRPRAD
jgi:hypothetical protein